MSLIVSLIAKNSDVEIEGLEKEISKTHNELFGFETWRRVLWGHDVMEVLGCKLLHSLQSANIYVFNQDIYRLKEELGIVKTELELIAMATGIDKEAIEFRVNNALEHIRIAENNIDKVGVAIS